MKQDSLWEKFNEVVECTDWMDKYGIEEEELTLAKFLKKEGI